MPIACSALMCHAPITIPPIAQERLAQCRGTTDAMGQAADRILSHAPDLIVLVDPHAPRRSGAFGICDGDRVTGSFARFGHPEVEVAAGGAPACAVTVRGQARAQGLQIFSLPADNLSHGAGVPLWFLQRGGLACPVLVISLPYPGEAGHAQMGRALAEAAGSLNQRWALLASGDMSHRLMPDAPAGYHPRAHMFDERFVADIHAGDLRRACEPDPELQGLAAEDVVDSCRVVSAACEYRSDGHEVLHYEGPFGVGYLEAILYESPAARPSRDLGPALLASARNAIGTYLAAPGALGSGPEATESLAGEGSRGVFVTLRNPDGTLRGCVGHIEPVHDGLAAEIDDCALAAATEDPRFTRLRREELAELRIEVSLLSEPEPVADLGTLHPQQFGVIVARGRQRGVLLPQIEGVRSVTDQLAIACEKAGFQMGPDVSVQRFTVEKFAESPASV